MKLTDLYTRKAHDAGTTFEVTDPDTKKGIGLFLSIVGPDSKLWRKKFSEHLKEMIKAKADGAEPDEEYSTASFLASITTGWKSTKDIEVGEFATEKVLDLYINAPTISDQVNAVAGKHSNFTGG